MNPRLTLTAAGAVILASVSVYPVIQGSGWFWAGAGAVLAEYAAALHLFPLPPDGWTPRVLTCSALAGNGVAEVWSTAVEHHRHLENTGYLARRRSAQAVDWLNELIGLGLRDAFRSHRGIAHRLPGLEAAVTRGQATPFAASRELLALFRS